MTKIVIVGEMFYSDLGIGGGPVYPPEKPPGIWGPTDPRPTPPIVAPKPPQVWPNPPGGMPPIHVEHPIPPSIWIGPVLPPDAPKPDPVEWHAAWSQETGWLTLGVPTGKVPTPSS